MFNWLYRYKIYHIFFWIAYHFGWWTIASGSAADTFHNAFFPPYNIKFLFYVVFQALAVYFNLYYLIPKFLAKSKYIAYVLLLGTSIFLCCVFIISGYYLTASIFDTSFEELFKINRGDYLELFKSNALPSTIASMTLAMSIKLCKNWIETRNRELELASEKVETELKFLKSQFNPHFLFNTINSIFVLIHKNQDMASESLAKFSDLMRYQLYECNESFIPLYRELEYLQNFIELGSLRLDNNVMVEIQVDKPEYSNLYIAPFILMPFIENSFKHVSQLDEIDNWLKINVSFEAQLLRLEVSNSTMGEREVVNKMSMDGGIGLVNVKRRLDLIYPDQYKLEINEQANRYSVRLDIELSTVILNNNEGVDSEQYYMRKLIKQL
ncbi:sensor histidine kinase [Spongiivirga citrea]|uniref:sensor histidine kinase n=1 Tax=Spongiivirga citrea TaxID=1481457 RepID=UPI001954664F|nr:histidine kinase [Spongiivirga citrea]